MQQVAAEFGMDWVMLTAVAAQESKFDSEVVSWAGAVGIMQVIPKYSEQTADSLLIPEINIREGARILSEHIQHYSYMDSLESWSFALASYNAGAGHIADALLSRGIGRGSRNDRYLRLCSRAFPTTARIYDAFGTSSTSNV